MRFSRKHMYMAATPLMIAGLAGPMLATAAANASVVPQPRTTEIVLKDGRGLDAQYAWQYNKAIHRWVFQATGKVVVDRNEVGRFGDLNQSEHFKLVYGPAGKMAYIQYTGPGKYHGYWVQTSDKHAPGIPPTANYGYVGSKLVRNAFEATIFTVSAPGPAGFRTLTVPLKLGPGGHGPEILTGEIFGQLGLNAMKPFALPTNAQLIKQVTVIGAHR